MSRFFQSELVRGDIQEMVELQQFCFRSAMNFMLLDYDRKQQYFEALERLIEKQKVFYARIELSDDPEAKSVADNMQNCVVMLGGNPKLGISEMFEELLQKIDGFVEQLDNHP